MDWLLPEVEFLKPFLSDAGRKTWVEALVISIGIWMVMRRRIMPWIKSSAESAVKALTGPITSSLDNLASEISAINKHMVQAEERYEKKFDLIEGRVTALETTKKGDL